IDGDAIEVPCPAGQTRVGVGQQPRFASIVRTVEAGFFRVRLLGLGFYFDKRIHAPAVRRNVDADSSPIARRQTVSGPIFTVSRPILIEPSPRFARILRTVKAAARFIDRSIGTPGSTM